MSIKRSFGALALRPAKILTLVGYTNLVSVPRETRCSISAGSSISVTGYYYQDICMPDASLYQRVMTRSKEIIFFLKTELGKENKTLYRRAQSDAFKISIFYFKR